MQHLIDDLPEQVALVGEDCRILAVNRAWTDAMARMGYAGVAPGDDYRAICAKNAAEGFEPAIKALAALDEMLLGERSFWELIFKGRDRWDSHEYQMCFHRVTVGGQHFITVTRSELTEILELRRLKDEFSKSLIEGQTIERQRLARELHDSTAQLLVAVGLLLGNLKRQSANEESVRVVEEIQDLMAEAQKEIRSISYLAHPPALEKLGLIAATNSLVHGFARRTNLEASFDFLGEPRPISPAAEGAIYRVAQEALSNAHRHASATSVRALLCFRRSAIHLVIADDGIGMSADSLAGKGDAGVGLASMRSRLAEIGGRLSILRLTPGTAIVASVPTSRN
jgi:signal transduction histidine kinase